MKYIVERDYTLESVKRMFKEDNEGCETLEEFYKSAFYDVALDNGFVYKNLSKKFIKDLPKIKNTYEKEYYNYDVIFITKYENDKMKKDIEDGKDFSKYIID